MAISKKMQDAFNAQIKNEFWSSNLYMEMAFWFRKEGWRGFSNWMFHQSKEESEHALEMANFVLHRGGEAVMTGFDEVPTPFDNPQAVFELTLKHEQKVTELINALADRKSTRLNSSHANISYAVFCLKKKIQIILI